MATHSSVLAWRIPGTGQPGGLLSMGSHRKKKKKKKKSLEGYSLWGHKRVGHNSVLNNNNMVCGSWVFGVLRF